MKKLAALALAVGVSGPAFAQEQQMPHADNLLHFDWMSDDQRQQVDDAHAQLASANSEMCSVMVDTYAEHAAQIHGSEFDESETAFLKRACAAKAFANHVEMSVELHDRVHREVHQAHSE